MKRVFFTGFGVVSPIGIGREAFAEGLLSGRDGIKDITLFDTGEYRVKRAGEVTGFDPKTIMGPKGLRNLDRSIKLLVSAAKLALADVGLTEIDETQGDDIGVAVGCTLGSLQSLVDFDYMTLTEGPHAVNPAHFPNTVINSPASQISIWCKAYAFNTTLSNGFTASLDAIEYAYDFMQWDRARLVLAGGVEELCWPTFMGFHEMRFLSGSKDGQPFCFCPLGRCRNGTAFAEGGCVLVMEDEDYLRRGGRRPIAEYLGFGNIFVPGKVFKPAYQQAGMAAAMTEALETAGCSAKDIDLVVLNANGWPDGDEKEARALREVFGRKRTASLPVTAVKSMFGEGYSVAGAFSTAAALVMLDRQKIAPTIHSENLDESLGLCVVGGEAVDHPLKTVMINTFGIDGNNSSLVIRRYDG